MDIVSSGPLRAASLLWQPRPGAHVLTVVCKATFALRPVVSPLANDQEPPSDEDNHWNDDPSRSLYSPSDLAPFKPRGDVLLVGSAFAPRGGPARSLVARLIVGDVDKSIEVFHDRVFTQDGQLREGARFVKMALRYERAAGGPDTSNPVGIRSDAPPDVHGQTAIPNLQPPGVFLSRRGDVISPIGFGPIAPSWPGRRDKLGRHRDTWPTPRWASEPLPEDIDPGYFNAAPRDQQVDAIRDNERIVLENLHPEHARLVTSLPAVRPRALVERRGRAPEALEMRADTLWIDTDRALCTLTWRGLLRLADRSEPGRVVITADEARAGGGSARIDRSSGSDGDAADTLIPIPKRGPVMPFVEGAPGESPLARPAADVARDERLTTMPLGREGVEERGDGAVATMMFGPGGSPIMSPVLPFDSGGGAPSMSAGPVVSRPGTEPMAPIDIAPPAIVGAAMISSDPIAPQVRSSPWAGSGARASGPTLGESAGGGGGAVSPNLMTPPGQAAAMAGIGGGVFAASNEAASRDARRVEPAPNEVSPAVPPAPEPRPRARAREVIKLLWFDPKSVARIRKHLEWRVLLAELELKLLEEGLDDDEEDNGGGAPSPKDRRDVFEVVAKGAPLGEGGVKLALEEAIGEDGKFEPPLVLVAGELEFPFDELETLKATAMAATPFAGGDLKIKEALDTVQELLKTPWLQGSGGMADTQLDRIRAAFLPGKRASLEMLESHTERMLLEQRCYQKRTVFGKTWIRAVLRGGGGAVVYVPEALRDELPLFKRVKVRMIGEVDMQEDQYESGGSVVKVIALGRVMG